MLFEKILVFILFLGPLVFFHELGHFLFARFFGVRVETFSLGFGPKIFKIKRGATEYVVSAIPLGGYVKMYGDDPFNKDDIPEDQQIFSFTHKNKWARFWIIAGGPLANFILAFALFFALLLTGERIPEIKLGFIAKDSVLFQSGLRTGDVLQQINGAEIYNPSDLVLDGKGEIKNIVVRRKSELTSLPVNFKGDKFFEEVIKHPPFLRKPIVVDSLSKRYIISLEKNSVDLLRSIEEIAAEENVKKIFVYPVLPEQDLSKDEIKFDLNNGREIAVNYSTASDFSLELEKNGFHTLDLIVKSVNMNSPADKAGIKGNDLFVSLEGKKVFSFEELRTQLQTYDKKEVTVEIYHEGKLKKLILAPEITQDEGKTLRLLGVYSFVEIQKLNSVHTQSKGFFGSIKHASLRTIDAVKKTVDGFVKLITNQVSLKSIGGPLAIGKVAHDSFNTSLSYFFQLMALISVNLGVINLFPIPVLDGGHILFIILEVLNGGPLSRRKMELAQQIGLSLLLMLMVGAIFNDVTRFF
jgi:regulator of sigma E protease